MTGEGVGFHYRIALNNVCFVVVGRGFRMARLARNFFALSGLLAVTLASTASPILAQNDAVTPTLIEKTAQANFREFFDLLSMPNDAINAQDIRKNADWLEAAFRKRGFVTKQLENNGKPLVFAEFARKSANAKTILISTASRSYRASGRRRVRGRRLSSVSMRRANGRTLRRRNCSATRSTRTGGSSPAPRPTTRGRS